MINWLATLIVITGLAFPATTLWPLRAAAPSAQTLAEFQAQDVSYQFGQQVTFRVQVNAGSEVQHATLYVTPAGQATSWFDVQVLPGNQLSQSLEPAQLSLRPFTRVTYRYQISLADGQTANSPEYTFQYDDNRFDWQQIDNSDFAVFWYERDAAFGQEVLNVAQEGLSGARAILDLPLPQQLKIYVYASSRDLQAALLLENTPWVAGHAAPDLDQVMISIPSGPEQKLELERQLPHEIMHILQYQQIGDSFQRQPVWLLEGMASVAELYPNPDYQYVLTTTAEKQNLLAISSLCASFPRESAGTYLAYAESESFVNFLYQNYGSSALSKLIQNYKDGLGCEEGFAATYNASLGQMEYRWKQEVLGIDAAGLVFSNLSPYLLMLALLLVPALLALLPLLRKKPAAPPKISRQVQIP